MDGLVSMRLRSGFAYAESLVFVVLECGRPGDQVEGIAREARWLDPEAVPQFFTPPGINESDL